MVEEVSEIAAKGTGNVNKSNSQFFNYEGREIVLYVDEIIDASNPQTTKMIQELNRKGVTIRSSLYK